MDKNKQIIGELQDFFKHNGHEEAGVCHSREDSEPNKAFFAKLVLTKIFILHYFSAKV